MNIGLPRIAIIVPAYNASAYIADTINSILEQSKLADEIVVVDDGSTDDTADVAAKVSTRLTVLRQKNAGPASARQHGVEATTAELLLFLDADDVLYTSALEKLSTALLRQPLAALVYCPAEIWSPNDRSQTYVDTLPKPSGENLWEMLLYNNFIRTPGCVLIRRSALLEVGGWDSDINLKCNDDWDLWLRLAEKYSFALITEPLLKYRVHSASLSKNRRKMIKSMFVMFTKQRSRWKQNHSRRRAVDAGEWHNYKYAIREIWRDARAACSKGQILLATSHFIEAARIVGCVTLTSVFNFIVRRLVHRLRVICGGKRICRKHDLDFRNVP